MLKFLVITLILWLILFGWRISQTGLDPNYQEPEHLILASVQQFLAQRCYQIWPEPQNALMAGMLVGSTEKLNYDLKQDLKNTSTIHIIVVSGQNLSILAGFLVNLSYLFGRKKTLVLTMTVLIFYTFLTGFQPPIVRAAIMAGFTYLGQLLGKTVLGWWGLLLSAGLMLVYNPNYLFSISFQLSFAATIGVVLVSPQMIKLLHRVPKVIKEDLGVSLSAQLLTLPIIAFYFGRVSLIGIVVNVLVLWTITPIMILGFISLLGSLISPVLGLILGLAPAVLLTYFVDVVSLFAQIPGGSVEVGQTTVLVWVGYYLVLLAWLLGIKQKSLDSRK
ncbi:ComEC/Rec2 family competence protein [Patescibacteria group bacterium]|nr:ComEC/Rec2 family competence protein [Patescibacteria group bacterium]MCL5409302.1 ComEC/Rec2 family competence protein [Patescibacteria group bacterium]